MEIKELQKQAKEAAKKRLSKVNLEPNVDLTMTHLMEEIGEIAAQINNKKLQRGKFDLNNLGEEIADSMILLSLLGEQHNINLEEVIPKKLKEIGDK
jgi:NTP pyrophosphatase (non-canonical NTP hydrolase)